MEAKDTAIKNKDILNLEIPCETCQDKPNWSSPTRECMECVALKHREAQAEISFKAGRIEERKAIVKLMNERHVGGVSSEWALSDKQYQSLKRGERPSMG